MPAEFTGIHNWEISSGREGRVSDKPMTRPNLPEHDRPAGTPSCSRRIDEAGVGYSSAPAAAPGPRLPLYGRPVVLKSRKGKWWGRESGWEPQQREVVAVAVGCSLLPSSSPLVSSLPWLFS